MSIDRFDHVFLSPLPVCHAAAEGRPRPERERALRLRALGLASGALAWLLGQPHASAQHVSTQPSTVLAPLAGSLYTPAFGQTNIGFYGTDLGYTFSHQGQLRILFGDSVSSSLFLPINLDRDDTQGMLCLSALGCPLGMPVLSNGDAVESYAYDPLRAAPLGAGVWRRQGPPISFRTNLAGTVASLQVYRGGLAGTLLNMSLGNTPVGAFSNAKSGAAAAAFAMFSRQLAVPCSAGQCSGGFTCDPGLGSINGSTQESAKPCVLGTSSDCSAVPSAGFCVDTHSSVYANTNEGRVAAVVLVYEIGNADPLIHETYYTQSWLTNKFTSPALTTVNSFVPGQSSDYSPPDATTTGTERLFMWGRPAWVGKQNQQRDAKLYFAYVDLPSYNATGQFPWAPQYWTGAGFSPNQALAAALNLSAAGADPTREKWDIVDQMTVRYVPALNRWVMLYGGDLSPRVLDTFTNQHSGDVVRDPDGAIHVRFAENPWGPFSAPQQILLAGNPATAAAAPTSQYGWNGILHSYSCLGTPCAPHDGGARDAFPWTNVEYGFLYAPNIIPEWTTTRSTSSGPAVDIYWNVSTMDPYEVVLVKSRIFPN